MQINRISDAKGWRLLVTSVLLITFLRFAAGDPAGEGATPSGAVPGPQMPETRPQNATEASPTIQLPPIVVNAPITPTPQSPAAAAPPAPVPTKKTAEQAATVQLPPIVVTAATRVPQAPDSTASTTTVLTHDFLEQSQYVDVATALQQVPGLSVVTLGPQGGQTSVFIHGLDSDQTLVTIDGRRQAVGISGADDNLANLTLDNIDQIEIVRTPVSSTDGGSAMGGVINLVTLSGRGLAQPISSASVEAGSFDSIRENIQSRGAAGDFDYAVSATRQDSSFPALSPGAPADFSPGFAGQADQYRNTSYRGNFGYQITPDVYVDLHTAYNNAYTSVPGEYLYPDPTASLLIEDWNLSPEIVAKVTDFYSTRLYYTHDQQRQAYDDPYNLGLAQAFGYSPQGDVTRLQINTESVDWQNDFQLAHNWLLSAGLQGDSRDYYEDDNGLGTRTFDGHDDNLGGFVSSQWQPLEGLNVLTSGRYDAYSQFGGAFTWRQGVSYTVAPTQTELHASVSRAFTPPPLQDLIVYYPSSYGPSYFPNRGLNPETDLGWEAGAKQPLWDRRLTPSATYFHNDVHGEIAEALLPSGNYRLENVDRATTDGVELGVGAKPLATLALDLNYTYLNATNDDTSMRLIRRPRQTLVFTGVWTPIKPLTFTVGGSWVLDRQDDAIAYPYNQVDAPDYFVLRASANYRINDHVSIWVRGENLTDRNYQPSLGYYATGMAGYGGIKVSF
jgi:vitamin B12 transporter